jgi:hypothetical protein
MMGILTAPRLAPGCYETFRAAWNRNASAAALERLTQM